MLVLLLLLLLLHDHEHLVVPLCIQLLDDCQLTLDKLAHRHLISHFLTLVLLLLSVQSLDRLLE